jgi:hypothetical protein
VKDSQFGSWSTTQEHTNNLKDKGIEDKNTFSPCIKNNKKKIPLSLSNRCDLTDTSQPMLGVLFFPLIPLSQKAAMHTIPENVITQLASQGRDTTRQTRWVSQVPQEKVQSR